MGKSGYNRATKWYDIKRHTVRDLIEKNLIRFQVIDSKLNPADGFTKPLDRDAFTAFHSKSAQMAKMAEEMHRCVARA